MNLADSRPSAGRRLEIVHHTRLRYADDVSVSFNEVRMTPLTENGQVVLNHEIRVKPAGSLTRYVDYWGAKVAALELHTPHRELEIRATSTVLVPGRRELTPPAEWTALREPDFIDANCEYLEFTELADVGLPSGLAADVVAELAAAPTPRDAIVGCVRAVRNQIAYEPGITSVATTASEAWAAGRGVCQDFSHATLAILRALGIPARYISGYLHTEEPAPGRTVVGESHAWVECWDGEWNAVDPTNDRRVGAAHVLVARGRDYADVPPITGIFAGGPGAGQSVEVQITQVE